MKLSEAIMLGSVNIKLNWRHYLCDGSGCLLGMGFNAVTGATTITLFKHGEPIVQLWPWLLSAIDLNGVPPQVLDALIIDGYVDHTAAHVIGQWAKAIALGWTTLEKAVDWIRSVEPAEVETTTTACDQVEAVVI